MNFPREGIDPNLVLAWLDDDEQRLFRACECSDLETTINVRVRLPEWKRRREKLPTTPGQEERQTAASKMLNDCFEAHANPRWIFQRLAQARSEARSEVEKLRAEKEELRLTLLNERGEGEPPVPGWTWADGAWDHDDGFVVGRDDEMNWCFATRGGIYLYPEMNTAREAMRFATTSKPTESL